MAEAVVSFVVERFGDLLLQEAQFLKDVSNQVEQLQNELKRMRCFLKDADARRTESESVRNWVAEIREAAYDAEDVIETFVLKVASRRGGGIKNILKRVACILGEGKVRHEVGTEIEAIKTRISALATSLETYGIKELREREGSTSSHERQREQRRPFPHVVERNVVGFEDNIKELVTALTSEDKHFRVVSICGMGGLGKTTLAKKVYHDPQVRRHFDRFVWAYISQQCQRRDIWEGIFLGLNSDVDQDRIQKLRDEQLAEELHKFLQDNKCMVVIDDIWSIEAWDRLKAAFPDETGSTILLTSRNKDVALYADPRGFLHEPQCLNDEQSWELFQKIAFSRTDNAEFGNDGKKEELGKQMARECAGLPLAITVLAGLLATKHTLNQWQIVHQNIKTCITRGIGHGRNHSAVLDVLSLSYDDLPPQLKQCFLYLGHFPEDYEIRVDKLIKFWIAEGIITSVQDKGEEGGKMLEDVAESYLEELVERSVVLVGARNISNSKLVTCRLHDLMRDLCLLKAEEESLLRVINPQPQNENGDILSSSSAGKFRRLAVHLYRMNDDRFFDQKNIGSPYLRSLLYFNRVVNYISSDNRNWKLLEPTFNHLKLLRVLDLEGADIKGGKLPREIGKLIHLRFLSLRDANVSSFPSSLGNLRLLQTLDLRVYDAYVPNVIWKMGMLRHLYLPSRCDDKTKLQLGNLRHLRTLVNFQVGICDVRDLFNMTNLRELAIYRSSKSKALREIMPASLSGSLKHLESLSLGGTAEDGVTESGLEPPPGPVDIRQLLVGYTNLSELVLYVQIEKLPDYLQFPHDITSITLGDCKLEEDPMPVLEKLINLRAVSLRWDAYTGSKMVCSAQGFPQLHSLDLFVLNNLEEWQVEEGAMSNLHCLSIGACTKLKTLPDAVRVITTLQELEFYGMPKAFKDNLVEGGEDFCKVQHVPAVVFEHCDQEYSSSSGEVSGEDNCEATEGK